MRSDIMAKSGPEAKRVARMRGAGAGRYGTRLVIVKYHGSAYSEAGVSDLLCCLDGKFIAIEVKAPESYGGSHERAHKEGPTIKQRAFIKRVRRAGGAAFVCTSAEEFLAVLAEVEKGDWHGELPHV